MESIPRSLRINWVTTGHHSRCFEVKKIKSAEHFDGTGWAQDLETGNSITIPELFNLPLFFSHLIGAVEAVDLSTIWAFHPTFVGIIIQSAGFTFFLHVGSSFQFSIVPII
jgi:hypothetical protein